MLHILFIILKIIGIIIVVILGMLLLLLCILFFVPVRYQFKSSFDGTTEGIKVNGKVTWLLHLFIGSVVYENQQLEWNVRIAWKRKKNRREDKTKVSAETIKKEGKDDETELAKSWEEYEVEQKKTFLQKEMEKSSLDGRGIRKEDEKESELHERPPKKDKCIKERPTQIIRQIADWFIKLYRKIKCTIEWIYDKIHVLSEKKEKLADFITDEIHRKAFVKVKKELWKFLRRIKPKRLQGNIHYGFEDPYRTGQVLAGLSIVYPFMGERVLVCPDFEKRILEGDLELFMIHIIVLLCKVILYKEVRITYQDIKNFEL